MKIYVGYVEWLKNEKKSSQTIKNYCNNMRIVSKYFWDKNFDEINLADIKKITKKDIKEFKYFLDKKGNKAATIRLKLDSLNSVFEYLIDEDILSKKFDVRQDIKDIKKKTKDSKKEVPSQLTMDDVNEIFQTIRKIGGKFKMRRILVFHLLSVYGLRREEVVNLRLDYFDFEENCMYVLGKNSKGRILPLLNETKNLLRFYLEEREKNFSYGSKSEYLICSRKGEKLTTSGLSQDFGRVVKELEIKKRVHPHKLRSLFATTMYNVGEDVFAIKELMGHSSLSTTNRYIKNFEKAKREAMQNNPFKDIKFI
ncbi:TPA: tyrosine-type recombinase/integrase [Clostridium perfringens]|nr:tyrosine-type recombinase/integrase [Clostridium perfringens]